MRGIYDWVMLTNVQEMLGINELEHCGIRDSESLARKRLIEEIRFHPFP